MSKKAKKRITSGGADATGSGRIQSGATAARLNEFLCFSFKYYDPNHGHFHCRDRNVEYFTALLARLKTLCMEQVVALTTAVRNPTTRFHRIDRQKHRVSAKGFGIPGHPDFDDEAWQFSLSVNEHGRVHGFLIGNVFYLVWLDPEHKLYPGQ